MSKPRILVLLVHPNLAESRANRFMAEKVKDLSHVTVHDLYAAYPDFRIDVKREQEILVQSDVIVFQHPFYWYSSPALLKEWQDRVLEYGFAFGSEGTALHGKDFVSAISTGGPREAYQAGGFNNYTISELLRPFQQTANLCGMIYRPPFVVHGAIAFDLPGIVRATDEDLQRHAEAYRALLDDYRYEGPST